MPLYVHFQPASGVGHAATLGFGAVRVSEAVATGASGALTAQEGEVAILLNTEAAAIYVAHGSAPNAAATTVGLATSARYVIPAGTPIPVRVAVGDKFAAAVIS